MLKSSQVIFFTIFLFFFSGSLASQDPYFPPTGSSEWETLSPESMGYCQERIDSLYNFLDERSTKAFLLLKDGKIILEHYTGTFTADSSWYWASAGKTLTAFNIGMAQDQGFLSIEDNTSQHLGAGWTSCASEEESLILIRDQLSMTSGLDDGVPNVDCSLPECLVCLATPGTRWAYHNGPYTLLDAVMEGATGQNLNLFLYFNLSVPTGISGLYVQVENNNVFFSKPRAMARFGILMQNNGIWNGNTLLGDPDFLYDMTHPSQELNQAYGYLTWLNGQNQFLLPGSQFPFQGSLMPDAPDDMYAALGKNGQMLNVVPSTGMIMVRMGNEPGSQYLVSTLFNNEIWQYINALECEPNGLAEIEQSELKLIPTSNSDEWLIQGLSEQNFKLQIFDTLGRLLVHRRKDNRINLSGSAPGIYILNIESEAGRQYDLRLMKY